MTQNDLKPGDCFPAGTEDQTINVENFGTSMELLQMCGLSDLQILHRLTASVCKF